MVRLAVAGLAGPGADGELTHVPVQMVMTLARGARRLGDELDEPVHQRQALLVLARRVEIAPLAVFCHPADEGDRARAEAVALELPRADPVCVTFERY